MKTVTKRLSIGLLAVALGSAVIGAAGPAMARGGHGGGHHGGWGHHGGGWGHGWGYGFGYGGYTPTYDYGGCYPKYFSGYDGDIGFKKLCY